MGVQFFVVYEETEDFCITMELSESIYCSYKPGNEECCRSHNRMCMLDPQSTVGIHGV